MDMLKQCNVKKERKERKRRKKERKKVKETCISGLYFIIYS
jgi:hypothetical protein